MKILLVAPFSKDTVLGVIGNYCLSALIKIGGEVDTFDFRASQYLKYPAGPLLKKAFRRICGIPHQRLPLVCYLERQKMNRALILKVKEYKPDLVLILLGDTILPEILEEIKDQGAILANWFHDTALDPDRRKFMEQISPIYDYFFIYDSAEVLQHIKIDAGCVRSIPLACNPEIHRTITLTDEEKTKYGSEVCFIGKMKYKREELLRTLKGFDLAIWGNWDKEDPRLLNCYRQKNVYNEEAVKIYNASDIALDIHIFYGLNREAFDINPRVYESTACAAFTITNENPRLSEFYEIDKEIVCYQDENDLKEKIHYYLEHPLERKKIALKGQERSVRDHTYENRLSKIISIVKGNF